MSIEGGPACGFMGRNRLLLGRAAMLTTRGHENIGHKKQLVKEASCLPVKKKPLSLRPCARHSDSVGFGCSVTSFSCVDIAVKNQWAASRPIALVSRHCFTEDGVDVRASMQRKDGSRRWTYQEKNKSRFWHGSGRATSYRRGIASCGERLSHDSLFALPFTVLETVLLVREFIRVGTG